jgi:hypothetical protein
MNLHCKIDSILLNTDNQNLFQLTKKTSAKFV